MLIHGAVLRRSGAERPFDESRPLEVTELQLSDPGVGEVLVRIEAAGVCHSDLSVIDGNRPRPLPMLLGHEAAGRVHAIGDGVAHISVGDRVVMTFLPRCEACAGCQTAGRLPCELGSKSNHDGTLIGGGTRLTDRVGSVSHHLGISAFANYAVVDARSLVVVGQDVPPGVAALLGCAVLTGGGAVLNAGQPEDGADIAIVGLGGVGMAALLVAAAVGTGRVYAIDSNETKFALAHELGAHECLTPEAALARGIRAAVVVEAAGHPRAFETAYALTAPGGKTVTVGLPAPGATSTIEPLSLTAEARTIIGSYLGSAVPARDIPIFVEMWRAGRLPVERLISATIGLNEINEAMDALADGTAIRQIITFE